MREREKMVSLHVPSTRRHGHKHSWVIDHGNSTSQLLSSRGFPGGPVVKNLPCNEGDTDSIPGPGRSLCHGVTESAHHNY